MGDDDKIKIDPFDDKPTKYETFLHDMLDQQMQIIGALLMKYHELDERLKAHEAVHVASSREIMRHADPIKKEEKPN